MKFPQLSTVDTGHINRRWVSIDHPGWRQAHAPSLIAVGGTLLVTWFAGTREGTSDNRIWLARRSLTGVWSTAHVVATGNLPHWNPVLAHGPDGAVWLFYKQGDRISTWTTWVMVSRDAGDTWSQPSPLVEGDVGGRGPVKNPPVLLPGGIWLAPASVESWDPQLRWQPFIDRSLDGGATWEPTTIPVDHASLSGAGLIQPALWADNQYVHALMRSSEGFAYRSTSTDAGASWSFARVTTLPNNNSGLCVIALPGGGVAAVHNPVSENWGPRCPLVISVSNNAGSTWRLAATVEDGRTPIPDEPQLEPSIPGPTSGFQGADEGVVTDGTGEYSYPSAIVHGTELHIAYTWQRRGVVCATISLDQILGTSDRRKGPPSL